MFYPLNSFVVLQLGGLNSLLGVEMSPSLPIVSKAPTLILGMDVSHGSPGQSDIPSIAAVSDNWLCVFYKKNMFPNDYVGVKVLFSGHLIGSFVC